jgi:hypothetical protein
MLNRFAAAILSIALLAPVAAADFAHAPAAAGEVNPDRIAARKVTREEVRAALAARRKHNLAAFHAYRTAGVYPQNTERTGPMNIWRDPDGHLCAAATMIDKDGQHDLVMDTAKTNNHARLADVTDGPLLDWMLTSGFTIAEIDRIQAPMVGPDPGSMVPKVDENARLALEYRATEKWLAKHEQKSLDEATDVLIDTYPALAATLVAPPTPAT